MEKMQKLRMEHRENQQRDWPPVLQGSEHFITWMDKIIMQRVSEQIGAPDVSMDLYRCSMGQNFEFFTADAHAGLKG